MDIVRIIITSFQNIFLEKDINISSSNGEQKIEISNYKYYILISYDIVDSFYRIRVEDRLNNQICFLTQSKKYHKNIKKIIKKEKLEKTLEGHIIAFTILTKEIFINRVMIDYDRDLKFDGLFLQ